MSKITGVGCVLATLLLASGAAPGLAAQEADASREETVMDWQADQLRMLLEQAPLLPMEESEVRVVPPEAGWEMGMASWVAVDGDRTYVLQRGEDADPVLVLDREGRVVDSWGRGLYETAHAIRVDPDGNVWTADARSSRVLKYSPDGRVLLDIAVGGQPADCDGAFCGTTDVGFGPDGRVYIADGYANARILEYTADGRRVNEWGTHGTGPGQFDLPHSIAVDAEAGVVYVADRENGRIQRFDLDGNFLGMWTAYGKTFGLHLAPGVIWLASQHRNERNLSPGWLQKVDRETGDLLGYVHATGVHGISGTDRGDVVFSPGPELTIPRWFSPGGGR